MIKIDENTTEITGELHDILGDTTHLLRILYQQLKTIMGEDKANKYFAEMGKLAVMTDEELDTAMDEKLKEVLGKHEN